MLKRIGLEDKETRPAKIAKLRSKGGMSLQELINLGCTPHDLLKAGFEVSVSRGRAPPPPLPATITAAATTTTTIVTQSVRICVCVPSPIPRCRS